MRAQQPLRASATFKVKVNQVKSRQRLSPISTTFQQAWPDICFWRLPLGECDSENIEKNPSSMLGHWEEVPLILAGRLPRSKHICIVWIQHCMPSFSLIGSAVVAQLAKNRFSGYAKLHELPTLIPIISKFSRRIFPKFHSKVPRPNVCGRPYLLANMTVSICAI